MLRKLSRKMLNRKTLGVLCLLLAFALAFIVPPILFKEQGATTTVVSMTRNVEAGTVLVDSDVTLKEVGAYNLPDNVMVDKSQVIGTVATVDLFKSEPIMAAKINTQSKWEEMHSEAIVPEGSKLVTLTIPNPAAGAAGYVSGGDKIDVLYFDEASGMVVSDSRLTDVITYSVLNANLHDVEQVKNDKVKGDTDIKPAFITLVANEEQAAALVKAEKQAGIHLVFRG